MKIHPTWADAYHAAVSRPNRRVVVGLLSIDALCIGEVFVGWDDGVGRNENCLHSVNRFSKRDPSILLIFIKSRPHEPSEIIKFVVELLTIVRRMYESCG